MLNLSNKGVKKIKRVHRLVAEAYIPNPLNLDTVNHLNHNKQDNSVANLEWLSNNDNAKDGRVNRVDYKGEKASAAKLTME